MPDPFRLQHGPSARFSVVEMIAAFIVAVLLIGVGAMIHAVFE